MSQQNVETARALFERWNAGDRADPIEYCDPAVELVSPFSSVTGVPYRGYDGMRQWMRDVDEQFSEFETRISDVRAVADSVLVIGTVRGRGRTSEVEIELPMAWVADFGGDHRITRARIYPDLLAALEAVGLAEK